MQEFCPPQAIPARFKTSRQIVPFSPKTPVVNLNPSQEARFDYMSVKLFLNFLISDWTLKLIYNFEQDFDN